MTDRIVREATCACGQVRMAATGTPVRISICHCHECQRRTGSAFGAQARFDLASFSISGDTQTWVRTAESGSRIEHHFCIHCGSTVYYELDTMPGVVAIPLGLFADNTFPAPTVSVYENRQHPWLSLKGDMEHYG